MAQLTPQHIPLSFWKSVELFAMDVDGILTDGTIQISSDGTETKSFSILDGMGLRQVIMSGIAVAWISGRASGATTIRAKELGILHVIQGRVDKITALKELAAQLKLDAKQCIYMGDDDIDSSALKWAGLGISVPTAMPSAQEAAGCITEKAAGFGAVREVCEKLLESRRTSPNL